jgi:hypothetical protein
MTALSSPVSWITAMLLLTGCSSTVVKLEEAIPCPISVSGLAETCTPPVAVADGATYADILVTTQTDRKSLRTCAAHDDLLRQTIDACNAAIAKHNEAVKEINQKYATKP